MSIYDAQVMLAEAADKAGQAAATVGTAHDLLTEVNRLIDQAQGSPGASATLTEIIGVNNGMLDDLDALSGMLLGTQTRIQDHSGYLGSVGGA